MRVPSRHDVPEGTRPRPAEHATVPLWAERPAAPRRGAVAHRTEKPPKGWR